MSMKIGSVEVNKMFERELIISGIWIGYFITVFCFMLFAIFMLSIQKERFNKYLLETKQHQKYAEWFKKNQTSLKVVKG